MPSCNTYHLTWVSLTLDVGISLHGCSSKAQPLLLTLDKGYLLSATIPDLQRGIAPLGLPAPAQPLLPGCSSRPPALVSGVGGSSQLPPLALGSGWLLRVSTPGLGLGMAPQGHCPWPRARGGFSRPPLTTDVGCLLPAATGLGRRRGWRASEENLSESGRGLEPELSARVAFGGRR